MHWSKARGIDCDGFVMHNKLDQCLSFFFKMHSNPKKIGSHRVFSIKNKHVSNYLCSFSNFEQKLMVQGLCDCFLFVGWFHYRVFDNKNMAKCKQNPLSKGGEEGTNDI
jgi:hypothetical protein